MQMENCCYYSEYGFIIDHMCESQRNFKIISDALHDTLSHTLQINWIFVAGALHNAIFSLKKNPEKNEPFPTQKSIDRQHLHAHVRCILQGCTFLTFFC